MVSDDGGVISRVINVAFAPKNQRIVHSSARSKGIGVINKMPLDNSVIERVETLLKDIYKELSCS